MRNTMYELIKSRNYKNYKNKEKINPETIEEISRVGIDVNSKYVSINPHNQIVIGSLIDNTFKNYLTVFMSNTNKVRALPYYLIPVGYLLKNKILKKLYVDINNNQIPKSLSNE